VYLDQKDWINLSRSNQGLQSGAKYDDALLVARAGVEQGRSSFRSSSSVSGSASTASQEERSRRAPTFVPLRAG
jgi:hypothetical protein